MVKQKRSSGQVLFAHITIGIQLAITILLFVLGGNWLDKKFNNSPLFLAICTAIGMAVGFYHLMKDLKIEETKDQKYEEKKRKKWNWH
jgi:F0F1-type ATP synthase assembly protein I